ANVQKRFVNQQRSLEIVDDFTQRCRGEDQQPLSAAGPKPSLATTVRFYIAKLLRPSHDIPTSTLAFSAHE
ncbi:hypothetical protein ABTM75_19845, partial [Acinetobacter baumannii]